MARTEFEYKIIALFGTPVMENPTMLMQEAAFEHYGMLWRYINFDVQPEMLEKAVEGMRTFHFAGANITVPHKVAVMPYLDEISEDAKLIGAVNTIVNREGRLVGYNTDGQGFLQALLEKGFDPKGKKMVMIGAGGAARAAAVTCALAGMEEIVVVNRSQSRGREVSELVESMGVKSSYLPFEKGFQVPACDVLVNTTSIGLYPDPNYPDIDFDTVTPDMLVCDIIPNPLVTPFIRKVQEKTQHTITGLGMLVHQGARGFELWTGKKAPFEVMFNASKEGL